MAQGNSVGIWYDFFSRKDLLWSILPSLWQAIGDTYDDEDDEDEEDVRTTKRNTRKRKKRGSIIDEDDDEDDPSYSKKKRPDKVNDEKLKKQMRRIMDIVIEYKNE